MQTNVPFIPQPKVAKDVVVTARMTSEQKKMVKKAAKKAGYKSTSAFMSDAIISVSTQLTAPSKESIFKQ